MLFSPPQSNQRGIETSGVISVRAGRGFGLNRTSVGLKRKQNSPRAETAPGLASIEPAWD